MLPLLYDIYCNSRNKTGVNALFLYPLNALIGSQRKRMDTWCRALNGIQYAIYNGQTLETAPAAKIAESLPELISRKQIRQTPPQILFTNPSMLEYMLVRNKDVELLNNSKGSLRWILLDEAHTLTGSSAAEMALLIRRVVDAFEVDIKQLRFAITSATVGSGEDTEVALKKFMSNLCGIEEHQIIVIKGSRVTTQELPKAEFSIQKTALKDHRTPALFKEVQTLRQELLSQSLSLSTITQKLGSGDVNHGLTLVDQLSAHEQDGKSILPVRGHFFARGIGGVFVCTDPRCRQHLKIKPASAIGTMTTIAGSVCTCGAPLLELVACRSCGNQFLESELKVDFNRDETLQLVSAVSQDPFAVERPDDDDDDCRQLRQLINFILRDILLTHAITVRVHHFRLVKVEKK
jgi:DEAD/DEAH box helicase domain-containing protein